MARPKSDTKRAQIIDAARTLFLANGLRDTSMTDIAAAAGVAKQTLYSHFTDKDALFTAVVSAVRRDSPASGPLLADPELLVALAGLGSYLLGVITDPSLSALRRIVVVEPAYRHLWSPAPESLIDNLAGELADRPELSLPDARRAAEHFLALVTHRASMDAIYGVPAPPRPDDHYGLLPACLAFLRAYSRQPWVDDS